MKDDGHPERAASPEGSESVSSAAPAGSATSEPQRLSLRTLLVTPVRQLASLIVPLVALFFFGGGFQQLLFLPLAILAVAAIYLVRWATFTYQVSENQVDIVHGVLNRQRRSIPLQRVRGVDVTATFLHRLLGLAVVRIDAAAGGESQQEGELDAVTAAEAERLRAFLLHHAQSAASPAATSGQPSSVQEPAAQGDSGDTASAQAQQQPISDAAARAGEPAAGQAGAGVTVARVRPRWYLYAPLTGYLFVPLALLGALVGVLVDIVGRAGAISEENVRRVFEIGAAMPYVLAVAAAFLAVVAIPTVAIVAFALTNWNFTLRLRESSLIGERGLLNRRSVSLERNRVRGWILRESLLQRLATTAGLQAVVAGLGDVRNRAELLPIAPRSEAIAAAGRAVGAFDAPLLGHPLAARTRRLIRAVVPWLAAAGVAAVLAVALGGAHYWWAALGLLVLGIVSVPLGVDRYRSLGHAWDGERLSVRSGSLMRQQVVVERRAVVGWTVKQTWLQRRVGLVTLVAAVGAGDGGYAVVDMSSEDAVRFANAVTPGLVSPLRADDPS